MMRRLALIGLIVTAHALAWSNHAAAFGTQRAHEDLARAAIRLANADGALDSALRDQLDLSLGVETRLALQFGLDDVIDSELITEERGELIDSRLNRSLSRVDEDENGRRASFPYAPTDVLVFFDRSDCRQAADFDACFAALERADITKLILIGTYAEDNPNPRSKHHFHDPEREHAPPSGNHGLDNSKHLGGAIEATILELSTAYGRGGDWLRALGGILLSPLRPMFEDLGNFDLRGRSAIDRALNTTRGGNPASGLYPDNRFALPDAERYLFQSIASPNKDERENYLALHFVAFGHVLHLLQDMGSVAHVRNDFIRDHVATDNIFKEVSLEDAADNRRTFDSVAGQVTSGALQRSLPFEHLAVHGSGSASLGFYQAAQPLVDPTGFDVADFWDREPFAEPESLQPERAGLAERVHKRFFSAGSISNSAISNGYDHPLVPSCGALGTQSGGGQDAVRVEDLPERSRVTGLPANEGRTERFLSSPLVPHLARCRFHAQHAVVAGPWERSVTDESVQRDYLELLFPLVIDYSAKFIELYYRPRLEVVATGTGTFRLRNRATRELRADPSAVEIVYTAEDPEWPDGVRIRAGASCDTSEVVLPAGSAAEPGPLSDFECHLPESLPRPARNRTDFWVVVRGKLGERGAVASADAFDHGDEDFVVAFDHVRPLALFSRETVDPEGAPGDGSRQLDVFELPIDETLDLSVPNAVAPAPVNLTAPLRDESGVATLDFFAPATWPKGSAIALRSDRDAPAYEYHPDLDAAADVFVLDRSRGVVDSAGLTGPLTRSRRLHQDDDTGFTPAWSRDGQALFPFGGDAYHDEDRLVRHDFPAPPAAPTPMASTPLVEWVASHSIDADPNDPALDLGTERDTCRGVMQPSALDRLTLAVVTLCAKEYVASGRAWESGGSWLPRIRIASVAAGPNSDGELAVEYTGRLDFGASQLVPCVDATCADPGSEPAGEENAWETRPSLSPDGTRLAFLRDPNGLDAEYRADLYVMPVLGSGSRRLVLPHGIGFICCRGRRSSSFISIGRESSSRIA